MAKHNLHYRAEALSSTPRLPSERPLRLNFDPAPGCSGVRFTYRQIPADPCDCPMGLRVLGQHSIACRGRRS